ncbi:MAG: tetratricopeptide repeat protein [Bacteroidetes bacterium]|nr:tetratricopeptide repeat protein [Bacteroidota bacterium]
MKHKEIKNNSNDFLESFEKILSNKLFLRSILAGIILLTFAIFYQVANFDFINYDDDVYVYANNDIRDFSLNGIKKIILNPANPEHIKPPLTIISLAINYYFGALNPKGYHTLNLFFHLANILLVFAVMRKFTKQLSLALFVAAFFAIHPFAVEAVSWVSARKEVQYTFFYLIALYFLSDYLNHRKFWQYLLVFCAFVLSFYSKFAAITFPILFLALSFLWFKRKDYFRTIMESLPFFFVSLYAYLESIFTRSQEVVQSASITVQSEVVSTITSYESFSLLEKAFLGGYTFLQYIIKYIIPLNLRLIYPYPLKPNNLLPPEYYIFTIISLLIIGLTAYFYFKHKWHNNSILNLGLIFFFIHISLLLHILPIGGRVVMAERYLYLPQIGLLIILFYSLKYLLGKFPKHQKTWRNLTLAFFAFYVVQTIARVPVWQDSKTMFTDLTQKEPECPLGFNNLAYEYMAENRFQEALHFLDIAIKLDPNYTDALGNIGNCFVQLKQPVQAEVYFTKAIDIDKDFLLGYYNLGLLNFSKGETEKAIEFYKKTLELEPGYFVSLNNLGSIYEELGETEKALNYYNLAIQHNPYFSMAITNRGFLYLSALNDEEMAMKNFDEAIKIDPAYADAYINRAYLKVSQENLYGGIADFTMAVNILQNNTSSQLMLDRAKAFYMTNQAPKACSDLNVAVSKGNLEAKQLQEQICRN